MFYLLKTEPSEYSFSDLQSDGTTTWDGVTNPQAVKHLREMKPGNKLLVYHTGDEKRIAGSASVVAIDTGDPKVPRVTIKAGKPTKKQTTLAEIKENKLFAESPLVRQSRLSVVPLTAEQYRTLAGE